MKKNKSSKGKALEKMMRKAEGDYAERRQKDIGSRSPNSMTEAVAKALAMFRPKE